MDPSAFKYFLRISLCAVIYLINPSDVARGCGGCDPQQVLVKQSLRKPKTRKSINEKYSELIKKINYILGNIF